MLTIKFVCVLCFLLSFISEVCLSEYLRFGGTEEESKQADYYLSADSGSQAAPTDELRRTQRSFWRLFKNGLFGKCGNCCNNCTYNVRNGNLAHQPLLPFQPLQPLPLWRPLKPLFGRLKCDSCGTSNYAGNNINNCCCDNSPGNFAKQYENNGVNSPPNYNNNFSPGPEHVVYEIQTELPPVESDCKVDNGLVTVDSYIPSTPKSEISPRTNGKTLKDLRDSNKKVPNIRYQPIICTSPQYPENKPLNQDKQQETKYCEGSKKDENLPYSELPALSLGYPPKNPSVSAVSAVYNIITPTVTTTGNPSMPSVIAPGVPFPNYIPLCNYPLKSPESINSLSSLSDFVAHRPAPILLTHDDQPYRDCPELFEEYHRRLNNVLPENHDGTGHISPEDSQLIHY